MKESGNHTCLQNYKRAWPNPFQLGSLVYTDANFVRLVIIVGFLYLFSFHVSVFVFLAAARGVNTFKGNNMGQASNLRNKISPPGADDPAPTPRLYAKELADRLKDDFPTTRTPPHKHTARKDMSDMSFGSPPTEMDMLCQKEGQLSGTDSRATRYKRRRPSENDSEWKDDPSFFMLQPSPRAQEGSSAGFETSDVAELERELQESKPAFEFSYFSSSFESSPLTPQPHELASEATSAATHHDSFTSKQVQADPNMNDCAAAGIMQPDSAQGTSSIVDDHVPSNYSALPIK
jgi:hypothetical protein